MDDVKLLNQIGELIDNKLKPIKEQLYTVEMKVELVNKRVEKAEKSLFSQITKSQEDTISTLTDLITHGYELHEERIKKIEDQLKTSQIQ